MINSIVKINEDTFEYRDVKFYKGWLRNGGWQYIIMITNDLKNKFPNSHFGINGATGIGKTQKEVKRWIDRLYEKTEIEKTEIEKLEELFK